LTCFTGVVLAFWFQTPLRPFLWTFCYWSRWASHSDTGFVSRIQRLTCSYLKLLY